MGVYVGTTKDGKSMHYSVGALIEQGGKYLLLDRANPPFGFAAPAGHVDEGETKEEALVREVKEETGLTVKNHLLLIEEDRPNNRCVYGVEYHRWFVFRCNAEGSVKHSDQEAKSIGWYTPKAIKTLTLEPAWKDWFVRLGVIRS